MTGIQKLHLEDASEDSPRTRQLLNVFEEDAIELKKFSIDLHGHCQRIMNAQNELSAATLALSQHLSQYGKQESNIIKDDTILHSALKQFSSYLDDFSTIQQVLCTQMSDNMMYPLARFLQADIEDMFSLSRMYHLTSHELEQSLGRYMKLPKKRDNEKMRYESTSELYAMRKKFHQTSLHYYAALNSLQYKRKCFLLEPLIGFIQANQAHLQMCIDAMCRKEITDFLENINSSIQEVKQELNKENQKTVSLIEVLEKQGNHLYVIEPSEDMPYIPPNVSMTQKSGYLFMRSRQVLSSKWDRFYFFVQGGNIMIQKKTEVAGSLLLDLNDESLLVNSIEVDDRRFVFSIFSNNSKRNVILQAENERERDEWIFTIRNVIEQESTREKSQKKHNVQDHSVASKKSPDFISIPSSKEKKVSFGDSVPPTPPSSPSDPYFMDTPIQFDLIGPNELPLDTQVDSADYKRANIYDGSTDGAQASNEIFSKNYIVRFCGSMEVRTDRGDKLILQTIQQIMAARAIHNIFKMTESRLVISNSSMRLLNPTNHCLRLEFALEDISYWSSHSENHRLFGFITRNQTGNIPTFACHVFESDVNTLEICESISMATTIAFQSIIEKKAKESKKEKEKDLLLYNISQLPDLQTDDGDDLTRDVQTVQIDDTQPYDNKNIERAVTDGYKSESDHRGDGDERCIEGAESHR